MKDMRAPCGCFMFSTVVDGENVFMIEACALGEACETVQFVYAESVRQQKPLTKIDMRGK